MKSRKSIGIICGLAAASQLFAQAPRVEFPAASPASTIAQRAGLTDIEIVYSRPGVKGRQVFGGLVPFGEVWRTGANASTKLTFSTPVVFGGTEIPAGTYALYSIPGEKEWTVILSKKTDLWGAFGYDPKDDFLRVTAKPVKLAEPVETFTIDINDIRDEAATLNLTWERTRVPVEIGVSFVDKLVPQIEAAMAAPEGRKPYYQAASFYYDHDLDLGKARAWIDAAIAERADAYWALHVKAKVHAKLGDSDGARAAATRSLELATAAGDSSYVKSNNELLAKLGGK